MGKNKQKPSGYWTKERVTEESKKYGSRGEFALCNGTAYGKARINNWLDEFTWLKDKRLDFSNGKIDCVYAYEFDEYNSVYIGRTLMRRAKERNYEHIFTESDTVAMFIREHCIPLPSMKILEKNLTLKEGVEKEGVYVQKYKDNGWNILNRAKTGSVGKIGKDKWARKSTYQEALKYKKKGEFAKCNGSAYDSARRNEWLSDYTWFEEKQKSAGYWDDFDNCYKAASKCRTKTEFIKKYNRAYVVAKQNDWMKFFTWFNIKRVAHNKKWDYDTVMEEARKYHSKKEFGTNARGAYKVALANGWLTLYDWFEDTHTVLSNSLSNSWENRKKWTYDVCKKIANGYSSRGEFKKGNRNAYDASWRNKWLNDFFPVQ